ncbi:MAG: hypothetical protein PHH77_03530 [Victivallaceae bacterium]|nr:hypothetical protein [Victivallaceae bacterium]
MSEEIVLWKLKDLIGGAEMDIRTPFIEREIQVVQQAKVPLYVDGVLISDEKLAALNLERVGYTQAQLDTIYYGNLYQANPDLAIRVRQYKGYLDELGLAHTATMDGITAAVTGSETIEDKVAFALQCKTVYDAIVTNMEYCGSETPLKDTCESIAKLIQYLPEVTE